MQPVSAYSINLMKPKLLQPGDTIGLIAPPNLLISAGACYIFIVILIWRNAAIRSMGTLLREEFAQTSD